MQADPCLNITTINSMPTVNPEFKHTPFQDPKNRIRLLAVEPRNDDSHESIICTLTTAMFTHDSHPTYTGLSYAWGTPHKTAKEALENVDQTSEEEKKASRASKTAT